MPLKWKSLICAGTMVLCASSAHAQVAVTGTVFDPAGLAIADRAVQLESTEGSAVRQATTDALGHFRLSAIAVGNYNLVVLGADGLATASFPVHIGPSPPPPLEVHLTLETVRETVEVGNDSNAVSTDAGTNSDQVGASSQQIEKLPVLNQDIIQTFTPFLSQIGVGTKGVTLVVDGIEQKSAGVSASSIKSVSINNDPYSAEARSPGKGRIEIVTKAGTPQFHGTFNFTFRDASIDARPYFAVVRPVEQRRIYEGSFTGPVGNGETTTFLFSGSRQEDDLQASVDTAAALAAGIGLSGLNVDTPTHTTIFAARIARQLSARQRVSFQYNVEDVIARNQGVGGLVLPGAGVNSRAREDDLVFNDSFTVSPTLVNQLQLFLEKDFNPVRSVVDARKIVVDGAFTGGGAQANVFDTENNLKINDIVSWTTGRHFVKGGIVIPNLSRRAWEDHANRLGTIRYASLDDYANGAPTALTQYFGTGRTTFWANEIGVFAQDQILLHPGLQVAVGLRYDYQSYFDSFHNFSPRFSAAYAPGKERKTVYRGGAGVFYDRSGARPISELKRFNGSVVRSVTLAYVNGAAPVAPGTDLASLPTDVIQLAPDIAIPLATFFSFGFDRQVTKETSFAVTYRGNVSTDLFRSVDVNAPTGPSYTVRPDTARGIVRQIQSHGRQLSNALDLTFKGTAGRWFNGLGQYTLSRTNNDTGGVGWFPANQYVITGEYARANFDQLHRLNVLGTINEGHWLSLGVAANLYSGTPYTETSGVDDLHTTFLNERPAGIGRNTLTSRGYANLDLRWAHDFPLTRTYEKGPVATFALDAFNVMNHTNFSNYVGNLRSSNFAQPTAALPNRRLQFTARFKF